MLPIFCKARKRAVPVPAVVPRPIKCALYLSDLSGHWRMDSRHSKWFVWHVRVPIVLKGPYQARKSVKIGPFNTIYRATCWMDKKGRRISPCFTDE